MKLLSRNGTVSMRRQDGTVVCEHCVVADTIFRRMRGLYGKRRLDPGHGMLLKPAPAIQTWFMRFPIDAVFLDGDGVVVDVRPNLAPWHTAGSSRARSVLELPAGEAARRHIVPGDRLRAVKRIRVLVFSRDDNLVRVAAFLLSRAGFAVDTSSRTDAIATIVAARSPNAVVLDGTSFEDAGDVVDALTADHPNMGVVVLADTQQVLGAPNVRLLERWPAFEELVDQIERASARSDTVPDRLPAVAN